MSAEWSWQKISDAMPPALTASKPAPAVRAMLVAEVVIFMSLATACLWLKPEGDKPLWYFLLWIPMVVIPLAANIIHGDNLADSGLRVDNFCAAAKWVGIATAIMAIIIIVVGLIGHGKPYMNWPKIGQDAGPIFAFAIAQHYLLQSFVLRRLKHAGLGNVGAVVLTVLCFVAMHAPNPRLMVMTAVAATVWCTIFTQRPNIFALAISHCVLTLLARAFWPKAWHLGLAIGHDALKRGFEYGWW